MGYPRGVRVISNSAVSLDGKLSPADLARRSLGSAEDRRRMQLLRARADAILVGGRTWRTWRLPLVEPPGLRSACGLPERERPIINAVLTRRGLLGEGGAAGEGDPTRDPRVRLLVLGPASLDERAHRERLGAEVLPLTEPSAPAALDRLHALGCREVLVEGGGALIGPLVEAGRLDELHLTLVPLLIGGASTPSLLEGPGFGAAAMPRLELLHCEQVGDELYLHYRLPRREPGAVLPVPSGEPARGGSR